MKMKDLLKSVKAAKRPVTKNLDLRTKVAQTNKKAYNRQEFKRFDNSR